jgi:FkbM family methyltransferase
MRREALDFFSRYLRAGDKVIDVGANIGDVTQVSSLAVGSSGRVWSIEPHPKIFRYLQGNLALNRTTNVVAINTAVGEFQGELKFGNQRRDDMNKVGGGDIKVRVRQLDDVVEDGGPFALLKIDVEGYELFVLRGGRSVLERSECVYVEVSENLFGTFGYKVADLFTFLESEGFLLFIQTDRGLSAIDPEYTPKAVENVIATRNTEELKRRTGWSM